MRYRRKRAHKQAHSNAEERRKQTSGRVCFVSQPLLTRSQRSVVLPPSFEVMDVAEGRAMEPDRDAGMVACQLHLYAVAVVLALIQNLLKQRILRSAHHDGKGIQHSDNMAAKCVR